MPHLCLITSSRSRPSAKNCQDVGEAVGAEVIVGADKGGVLVVGTGVMVGALLGGTLRVGFKEGDVTAQVGHKVGSLLGSGNPFCVVGYKVFLLVSIASIVGDDVSCENFPGGPLPGDGVETEVVTGIIVEGATDGRGFRSG